MLDQIQPLVGARRSDPRPSSIRCLQSPSWMSSARVPSLTVRVAWRPGRDPGPGSPQGARYSGVAQRHRSAVSGGCLHSGHGASLPSPPLVSGMTDLTPDGRLRVRAGLRLVRPLHRRPRRRAAARGAHPPPDALARSRVRLGSGRDAGLRRRLAGARRAAPADRGRVRDPRGLAEVAGVRRAVRTFSPMWCTFSTALSTIRACSSRRGRGPARTRSPSTTWSVIPATGRPTAASASCGGRWSGQRDWCSSTATCFASG